MQAESKRWRPTGLPWEQWKRGRELEKRREVWVASFFASEGVANLFRSQVAAPQERWRSSELGAEEHSPPDWLQMEAVDDIHGRALAELFGTWLAVRVCARRLPTDPIGAGLDALDALVRHGGELRAQADHVRPIAEDRAPDGGRWHPWAMTHPESSVDSAEAARRDVASGEMEAFVELVDEGVAGFRQGLRRTQWISRVAHFLPLLALAVVVAAVENSFGDGIFLAILIGLITFLIVDRIVIALVVEPIIESWQRTLLDEAADGLAEKLGQGSAAAALIRQSTSG